MNLHLLQAQCKMHFQRARKEKKRDEKKMKGWHENVAGEGGSWGVNGWWDEATPAQTKPNEAPIQDDSRPSAPPRLHFYCT